MRRLDLEAHRLEREHDLPPDVLAEIDGREIEVAGGVVGLGGGLAVTRLEQEELGLGAGVHREAGLGRPGDRALERLPRAAGERGAVRVVDVADQARPMRSPVFWVQGRMRNVERSGREVHVRLLDAHEPLDRRAVEHDAAVERRGELAVGNLDVLDDPEDVGELQPQELDVHAVGQLEDLRSLLGGRRVRRRCVQRLRHRVSPLPPSDAAVCNRRSVTKSVGRGAGKPFARLGRQTNDRT